MTPEQAKAIVDAHDIDEIMDDFEEWDLLMANNPELADAYEAIYEYSKEV